MDSVFVYRCGMSHGAESGQVMGAARLLHTGTVEGKDGKGEARLELHRMEPWGGRSLGNHRHEPCWSHLREGPEQSRGGR